MTRMILKEKINSKTLLKQIHKARKSPTNVKSLKSSHMNALADKIEQINHAKEARYVIHGASIASPSFYRMHPVETVDANIWGLRSLLDFYI